MRPARSTRTRSSSTRRGRVELVAEPLHPRLGGLAPQRETLRRAAEPVEHLQRLLARAGRVAELLLGASPLGEQRLEPLVDPAPPASGRTAPRLELREPCSRSRRGRAARRARAGARSRPRASRARSAAVAWSASGRSRFRTSASTSRARSTSIATRASLSSARWRRALKRPSPAASSIRAAPLGRPRGENRLDLALADDRVHPLAEPEVGEQLDEVEPPHGSPVDEVLPLAAAMQPPRDRELRIVDGQRPVGVVEEELDLAEVGRRRALPPPAKRTSSGFSARSSFGLSEPAAQRIASETFDLPEPFGPTITPTPGSSRISTGSGKDLKPRSLTARRCTARHPTRRGRRYAASSSTARASGASSSTCSAPPREDSRMPRRSGSSSSSVSRRRAQLRVRRAPFGHGPDRMPEISSRLPRRRAPRASSLASASRAASCSASFFVPPFAAAELLAVDDRGAREAAVVRRAFDVEISVYDHRRPVRASSSCRSVFVVDPRGERVLDLSEKRRRSRPRSPRSRAGGRARRAPPRAPRRATFGVARAARARPPSASGACATSRSPSPSSRADHRAGRARDDVRARLRQLSLRKSGMPHVERVRDRELEHAVAEELEPLVRVAAVAPPTRYG